VNKLAKTGHTCQFIVPKQATYISSFLPARRVPTKHYADGCMRGLSRTPRGQAGCAACGKTPAKWYCPKIAREVCQPTSDGIPPVRDGREAGISLDNAILFYTLPAPIWSSMQSTECALGSSASRRSKLNLNNILQNDPPPHNNPDKALHRISALAQHVNQKVISLPLLSSWQGVSGGGIHHDQHSHSARIGGPTSGTRQPATQQNGLKSRDTTSPTWCSASPPRGFPRAQHPPSTS